MSTITNVERWSSRRAFVLAAMGSAIGLGNIWRFPYVTGENGGGAFVLVYLACIVLVGVPVMIAEVALGRHGRGSPVRAMQRVVAEQGLKPQWQCIGYLSVLTAFMLISVFAGVAGWSIAYLIPTLTGAMEGITPQAAGEEFAKLIASPVRVLGCHAIFLALGVVVVVGGVQRGIERAVKWLMPMLFVVLLIVVTYGLVAGDAAQAFRYLFIPDFSALSAHGMLIAVGQAFLSLSVATGSLFAYGAYVSAGQPIAGPVCLTALADTVVALLAGFAIFPLVFAYGMAPQEGAGLVFVTLTVVFGDMAFGNLVGALFFLLLTIATWTSVISSFEPVTVWIMEVTGVRRVSACLLTCALSWLVGVTAMLSFNIWADVTVFKMNIFELLAAFTTNVLLPVGAFLIALFAGWKFTPSVTEAAVGSRWAYILWRWLIRYVAPLGIAIIFVDGMGMV